ncbi:MAG: hypothetical protein ACE5FR_13995 [Rhodospirillales bacterium]
MTNNTVDNRWLLKQDLDRECLDVERRRLMSGVEHNETIMGIWVDSFYVSCAGEAPKVLQRAKELMLIVNEKGRSGPWPNDEAWPELLPRWFIDACVPEQTIEEIWREEEEFRAMTWEQQREIARTEKWSLLTWVGWMDPRDRYWLWWDAEVRDDDTLLAHVDKVGDPPPGEPPGFRWLFQASGAKDLDEVKDPADIVR